MKNRSKLIYLAILFLGSISCIISSCSKDDETSNTVSDFDGNTYPYVTIGTQVWMAQNLKVTHYQNGDPIPMISDGKAWAKLTTGAYCNYGNSDSIASIYGRLYNFYAVSDSRNIAPKGWHVPTMAEWDTLALYLGGVEHAGEKLKEETDKYWGAINKMYANNSTGFTALPSGYRYYDSYYGDVYGAMGEWGFYWSADSYTEGNAFGITLRDRLTSISHQMNTSYIGNAVRCIKDK